MMFQHIICNTFRCSSHTNAAHRCLITTAVDAATTNKLFLRLIAQQSHSTPRWIINRVIKKLRTMVGCGYVYMTKKPLPPIKEQLSMSVLIVCVIRLLPVLVSAYSSFYHFREMSFRIDRVTAVGCGQRQKHIVINRLQTTEDGGCDWMNETCVHWTKSMECKKWKKLKLVRWSFGRVE